jgi:hypothetical protein
MFQGKVQWGLHPTHATIHSALITMHCSLASPAYIQWGNYMAAHCTGHVRLHTIRHAQGACPDSSKGFDDPAWMPYSYALLCSTFGRQEA